MRLTWVSVFTLAAGLGVCMASPVQAQTICDTAAQPTTSVCSDQNGVTITFPTSNTDGSPLNDYGSTVLYFGPATGVCNSAVTGQSKNLGALGVPTTPLPNTKVRVALGTIGMQKGRNFMAAQVVDLTGNKSACTPEVQFVYDPIAPAAPGITVGP